MNISKHDLQYQANINKKFTNGFILSHISPNTLSNARAKNHQKQQHMTVYTDTSTFISYNFLLIITIILIFTYLDFRFPIPIYDYQILFSVGINQKNNIFRVWNFAGHSSDPPQRFCHQRKVMPLIKIDFWRKIKSTEMLTWMIND